MELPGKAGHGQGGQYSSSNYVTTFVNPATNTSLPCSTALATPRGCSTEDVMAGALSALAAPGNMDHNLGHPKLDLE